MYRFGNSTASFFAALSLDLKRAVFSFRFLASIILMLTWMFLNIGYELIRLGEFDLSTVELLREALYGLNMGPVLLVIATIPFATMYLNEVECGFQRELVKRVGIWTYGISKALVTFLSAFFLAVLSVLSFLGILTILGIPQGIQNSSQLLYYETLCATKGAAWYYAVKTTIVGLVCGLSAMFALVMSSYIPNTYAATLSPLIGYYLCSCIFNILYPLMPESVIWRMISPLNLCFGEVWLGSSFISFSWTFSFLLLLTALCGIQFVKNECGRAVK